MIDDDEKQLVRHVAELLTQRAAELGKTPSMIAKTIGYSSSYGVIAMLSGEQNMRLKTAARLASVLSCTIEVKLIPKQEIANDASTTD